MSICELTPVPRPLFPNPRRRARGEGQRLAQHRKVVQGRSDEGQGCEV